MRRLLLEQPSQRFSQVAEDPELRSRRVCAWLLKEAQKLLSSDSAEAGRLAELALFIADRLDPWSVPAVLVLDYQAHAWLLIGQSRTIAGELPKASLALQMSGCLLTAGTGDFLLQVDFLESKARLYRARGEAELARRAELRARRIANLRDGARFCS